MRRRRFGALAVAVLLAMVGAVTGSPMAGAAPVETDIRTVQVVEQDASKVLAAGVVRGAKGKAVGSGTVAAYSFPPADALKGLEVGDGFTLAEVGSARINPDGSYALSLDYDAMKQSGSGVHAVNLDLVATTPEGTTTYSETVWVDPETQKLSVKAPANQADAAVFTSPRVATGGVAGARSGLALDLVVHSVPEATTAEMGPLASLPPTAG